MVMGDFTGRRIEEIGASRAEGLRKFVIEKRTELCRVGPGENERKQAQLPGTKKDKVDKYDATVKVMEELASKLETLVNHYTGSEGKFKGMEGYVKTEPDLRELMHEITTSYEELLTNLTDLEKASKYDRKAGIGIFNPTKSELEKISHKLIGELFKTIYASEQMKRAAVAAIEKQEAMPRPK